MDAHTNRSAIVIVAKAPIPGRVKTRLCPPLSFMEAAKLYSCFLQDTVQKVAAISGAQKYLAVDGLNEEGAKEVLAEITPANYRLIDQGYGGLGERLSYLMELLFKDADRLIFIGADSPHLPRSYIEDALKLLDDYDIVIGPCEDGGYYLLGLGGPHANLFRNIEWSTNRVFSQTMERARSKALNVKVMPIWYDIDAGDDLSKLFSYFEDNPDSAPATAAFLRAHTDIIR